MRRRTFLASVAGLAATAGCTTQALGPAEDSSTTTTTRGGTTTRTTTTDENTTRATRACPSLVDGADRTVCYDDRGDAKVFLKPSEERFVEYAADDAVQTNSLTLHNDSDRTFALDVNDWRLARRTEGGWTHVAPDDHTDARHEVPAGGSYEWVLSTETHSSPVAEDAQSVVVDLESARTYAMAVHGTLGDEHVECVARFEYLRAVPEE